MFGSKRRHDRRAAVKVLADLDSLEPALRDRLADLIAAERQAARDDERRLLPVVNPKGMFQGWRKRVMRVALLAPWFLGIYGCWHYVILALFWWNGGRFLDPDATPTLWHLLLLPAVLVCTLSAGVAAVIVWNLYADLWRKAWADDDA